MLVYIVKNFVFTSPQMALKDIWRWIRDSFPFFTHCTKASLSDDLGLIEMLIDNIDYFKSKPVNIPKITILLDHAYHPRKLQEALKEVYPGIMRKIKFQLSAKPSKTQKAHRPR